MFKLFKSKELRTIFNAVLIGLVLLDIILLTVLFFININPVLYQLVLYFDLFVVLILILQFIYNFKNSTSKTKFLKNNWFDILGMVPEILIPGFATFLRYFRLIKILSLFRRNLTQFFDFIEKTHLEYGIITLIFILISAAAVFYFFENGINPSVNSIDDAMWYVLITVTTVGFGDIYPYTIGGRIATVIIIITGIGFISYLAASVTGWFFETAKKEEEKIEEEIETFEEHINEHLDSIEADVTEIKEILDKINKE